jgi:hypothetical protein
LNLLYIIDVRRRNKKLDGSDLVILAEQVAFNFKREWQKYGSGISIINSLFSRFCHLPSEGMGRIKIKTNKGIKHCRKYCFVR